MPASPAIYPLVPERLEPERGSLFLPGASWGAFLCIFSSLDTFSHPRWIFLIMGLAIGLIHAVVEQPRRRAAMIRSRPEPAEGPVLCEGWSNSDSGYLYLTESRLIYVRPGNAAKNWSADLFDLPLPEAHKTFGLFPGGISFQEGDNDRRVLKVADPERWEERIRHARLLQVIAHETNQSLASAG